MARRSSQRVVNLARQSWTLNAKNWTVVGQTKYKLATVDGQFIILIAHLATARCARGRTSRGSICDSWLVKCMFTGSKNGICC